MNSQQQLHPQNQKERLALNRLQELSQLAYDHHQLHRHKQNSAEDQLKLGRYQNIYNDLMELPINKKLIKNSKNVERRKQSLYCNMRFGSIQNQYNTSADRNGCGLASESSKHMSPNHRRRFSSILQKQQCSPASTSINFYESGTLMANTNDVNNNTAQLSKQINGFISQVKKIDAKNSKINNKSNNNSGFISDNDKDSRNRSGKNKVPFYTPKAHWKRSLMEDKANLYQNFKNKLFKSFKVDGHTVSICKQKRFSLINSPQTAKTDKQIVVPAKKRSVYVSSSSSRENQGFLSSTGMKLMENSAKRYKIQDTSSSPLVKKNRNHEKYRTVISKSTVGNRKGFSSLDYHQRIQQESDRIRTVKGKLWTGRPPTKIQFQQIG